MLAPTTRDRQLSHCKTKLNQILQKQACILKKKNACNIKSQKTKARFRHLLRYPAWKWSWTILVEWEGMKKQENRWSKKGKKEK